MLPLLVFSQTTIEKDIRTAASLYIYIYCTAVNVRITTLNAIYIYAERCKLIDLLRNYNNLSGAQIALRVIHGVRMYTRRTLQTRI